MHDDEKAPAPAFVPFVVDGIRGLYVPLIGGLVRLIPDTPEAKASAEWSLRWSRAAWQN